MSAETILYNVLRKSGLAVASPQISGSDEAILRLKVFMNEAGQEIAIRAQWSKLISEFTVPLGTQSTPLPADFSRLSSDGGVTGFRGITSLQEWNFVSNNPGQNQFYFLKNGEICFWPSPSSDVILNYISKNWVDGDKDEITENGDTLRIPEILVELGTLWRYKASANLPSNDIRETLEARLQMEILADRGSRS